MTSKILISVIGPTAIGKTKLSVLIAEHFRTEILSADSRQFFKEMSIGTAVPSKEELKAVKHHFIQHKSVTDTYSVGDFERDAILLLDELFLRKDVVVMVGGSGLYVDAVTDGLNLFPKVGEQIRKNLNRELDLKGIRVLQEKLQRLDPDYFEKVDVNNPHRLIRALEICIGTGEPYSSFLNQPKSKRNFKVLTIGLLAHRSSIYDNINQRVDIMMAQGLLDEAKGLLKHKDLNALQTVGYKELFQFLDGTWDLEFAVSEIKKNTRRFAKRQLTWFKKNKSVLWLDANYKKEAVIRSIEEELFELRNE